MEKIEQELRSPQALEWDQWARSDEGRSCLEPNKCAFAATRACELAFVAGVKAQAAIFRNALRNPPLN